MMAADRSRVEEGHGRVGSMICTAGVPAVEMACGVDPGRSIFEGSNILANWEMDIGCVVGGAWRHCWPRGRRRHCCKCPEQMATTITQALTPALACIADVTCKRRDGNVVVLVAIFVSIVVPGGGRVGGGVGPMFTFTSHECSNVCWELVKLQLGPPGNGERGDALPVGRVVEPTTLITLTTTTMEETSKRGEPKLSQLASRVCNLVALHIINDYALCLSPCMPSSPPGDWLMWSSGRLLTLGVQTLQNTKAGVGASC